MQDSALTAKVVPPARTRADGRPPRDLEVLQTAAALFRAHGISGVSLGEVAGAAGTKPASLARRYASTSALASAIFDEVLRRLQSGDGGPWYGYGAGFRRLVAAARSFEDGYVLLVRDAREDPAFASFRAAMRERTRRKLTQLLWFPERPPPRSERPALLGLAVEPMVSFCNDALSHWVLHGPASRDEAFVAWGGQMMRAWRHNAAEFLNLDSPEVEWPFDTENTNPLS